MKLEEKNETVKKTVKSFMREKKPPQNYCIEDDFDVKEPKIFTEFH